MKKFLYIFLLLSVYLLLVSCKNDKEVVNDSDTKRIIIDHEGRTVTLPDEINRIAIVESASPLPSILCVYFNSADKLVGMPKACLSAAKNSVLSKLYPKILDVDTSYMDGGNLNIEELVKLNPDIVFYTAGNATFRDSIENAGLRGVAISVSKWDYNVIETFKNWMHLFDEIFANDTDKSDMLIKYADEKYKFVQDRVKDIKDIDRKNLFIMFQCNENSIMTSGKKFFGEFWANAIGAKNVATNIEGERAVSINLEQLYDYDPSLIFITNFTAVLPEDLYENKVGDYDFSPINAIINKKVFKMPLGMYRTFTPGLDTPVTLLALAKYAYPELFSDVDIVKEVKNYYKNAFNVDLSDEDILKMFAPDKSAALDTKKY